MTGPNCSMCSRTIHVIATHYGSSEVNEDRDLITTRCCHQAFHATCLGEHLMAPEHRNVCPTPDCANVLRPHYWWKLEGFHGVPLNVQIEVRGENCSVCLLPMDKYDSVCTPCNDGSYRHAFHRRCLTEWFESCNIRQQSVQRSCPLCRRRLVPIWDKRLGGI
jgi:hypothetical protein